MQLNFTTEINNDPVSFSGYSRAGNHHEQSNCNGDFLELTCELNKLMAAGDKREVCRKLTRCILARRADGQGRRFKHFLYD